MFGILAGNEDQNDHDTLRSDPIFKMLVGKSPSDKDLASQPTISRLETWSSRLSYYSLNIGSLIAPAEITLDIDTYETQHMERNSWRCGTTITSRISTRFG